MKLFILLAAVTWSSGAKLDRAYLPPSYAQTSGGSGNFLQTPSSGPQDYQNNGFIQNNRVTGASANAFGRKNSYQQNSNDFSQTGNGFVQNDNGFAQNGNEYTQNSNNYAQDDAFSPNENFAQNGNGFSQDNGFGQNNNNAISGFNNLESRPERAQAAFERNAAILRQDSSNDGETFSYAFETENGIVAEENGVATNGVEAQGGYSYTGDDGQVYSIRYTADQNGFQPQGDHLPTPPPIPEEILKALEQNARDEANGIYDDGSYNEAKYGSDDNSQYNDNFNNGNSFNNNNNVNNFNAVSDFNGNAENSFNNNDDDTIVTTNALLADQGVSFRQQEAGFDTKINDANKAYLPPFERNGETQAVTRQYNQNSGLRPQPSIGFNSQASSGFRNQGSGGAINGVERAYLPPEQQFGQRSQNGASRRYQTPSTFGNQAFNGNQRNGSPRNGNGVDRAYLPPFQANPNAPSTIYDQPQNFGQRSQGLNRSNDANREYLPPSANQNSNARNGFGRRSSFSARNGYQY